MHWSRHERLFSYPAWRGSFYPEKLPEAKMLAYYAEQLRAVEINNTFYRMPTPEMLEHWAAETPDDVPLRAQEPAPHHAHDEGCVDVGDAVARLDEAPARSATSWARSCSSCRRT